MESWTFNTVGKGLVPDETVSTADAISRGKIGSMGWEVKSPFIFGSEVNIESQGFGEIGFPPLRTTSLFSPVMAATHNTFSEENESSSKLSSSIVEANCRESGIFDLKLGRIVDQRDTQVFNASKIAENFSSEILVPSKRTRVGGLDSRMPYCLVHGCIQNLSSCKDYYKRHKVCEVHSKTPKVIVNGMEQRFCQQCSRFHLLGEFDDGKRSCRKRLAGHNERRRKPHVGNHSGRHARFLPSYSTREGSTGSKFQGSTSSSMCRQILPNTLLNQHQQKYETNAWWHIKPEDETTNEIQSTSSITDGQLQSKSLSPCNFTNHYPPLQGNAIISTFDNGYIGLSNSSSRPHNTPIGGDEKFIFMDSASAVQGLSGIASDSASALSLLSSQSNCHSSTIPMLHSHPLLIPSSDFQLNHVSNNMNHKFDFGCMFQESKFINSEDRVRSDDGSTIDLLCLSSQLERVEHQKRSFSVKNSNDFSVA